MSDESHDAAYYREEDKRDAEARRMLQDFVPEPMDDETLDLLDTDQETIDDE